MINFEGVNTIKYSEIAFLIGRGVLVSNSHQNKYYAGGQINTTGAPYCLDAEEKWRSAIAQGFFTIVSVQIQLLDINSLSIQIPERFAVKNIGARNALAKVKSQICICSPPFVFSENKDLYFIKYSALQDEELLNQLASRLCLYSLRIRSFNNPKMYSCLNEI